MLQKKQSILRDSRKRRNEQMQAVEIPLLLSWQFVNFLLKLLVNIREGVSQKNYFLFKPSVSPAFPLKKFLCSHSPSHSPSPNLHLPLQCGPSLFTCCILHLKPAINFHACSEAKPTPVPLECISSPNAFFLWSINSPIQKHNMFVFYLEQTNTLYSWTVGSTRTASNLLCVSLSFFVLPLLHYFFSSKK